MVRPRVWRFTDTAKTEECEHFVGRHLYTSLCDTQVMALLLSETPRNYCPIKMRIFILLPRVRIFYFTAKIRYPSMADVKFHAPFL